jgi:uncharacterized protein (TIGR03067 family)
LSQRCGLKLRPPKDAFPLAALFLVAAAGPVEDAKKELDQLQGEWVMVSQEQRAKKLPDESAKQHTLTVKGGQWTVTTSPGAKPIEFTITIDPSKNPKEMDLTVKANDKVISRGIYKLEGDTLTLCRTQGDRERPKELKTTEKEGILTVWKRAKK